MLYQKLAWVVTTLGVLLLSPIYGYDATHYLSVVGATSAASNPYTCPSSVTTCSIYCDVADHKQTLEFHCGTAQRCEFYCNELRCGSKAIIHGESANFLMVYGKATECLKDSIVYAPDSGSAFFYNGNTEKPYKGMDVHSGANTQEIIVYCDGTSTADECKGTNIYASDAQFLKIVVGNQKELESSHIECPANSAYSGPEIAPCIIDAKAGYLYDVDIWAPWGTPKGVYITGTSNYNNVLLYCTTVNEVNGDTEGSVSYYPFTSSASCWWTNNPTAHPTSTTLSPTHVPTPAPTVLPTYPSRTPTSTPTVSPTISPTKHPTIAPTEAPTLSPTKTPTNPPTNAPTKPPTLDPTPAPTNSPTPSPTAVPSYSPTEQPTISPVIAPTCAPSAPPTIAPTVTPTFSPTHAPTGDTESPTNAPTDYPTLDTVSPTAAPTFTPTVSPTRSPAYKLYWDKCEDSVECEYIAKIAFMIEWRVAGSFSEFVSTLNGMSAVGSVITDVVETELAGFIDIEHMVVFASFPLNTNADTQHNGTVIVTADVATNNRHNMVLLFEYINKSDNITNKIAPKTTKAISTKYPDSAFNVASIDGTIQLIKPSSLDQDDRDKKGNDSTIYVVAGVLVLLVLFVVCTICQFIGGKAAPTDTQAAPMAGLPPPRKSTSQWMTKETANNIIVDEFSVDEEYERASNIPGLSDNDVNNNMRLHPRYDVDEGSQYGHEDKTEMVKRKYINDLVGQVGRNYDVI